MTNCAFPSISSQELHPLLLCSAFLVVLVHSSKHSFKNFKKLKYSALIQYVWSCSGLFDGHVGWTVDCLHSCSPSTVLMPSWLRRGRNYVSECLHMTTHPSSGNGSTKQWWFIPSALKLPAFRGKGSLLNKEMSYPTESTDIIELLIRAVILKVDLTAGFHVEGNQNYSRKWLRAQSVG